MPIIYDFQCIWAGFYSQYFFFLQSFIFCKLTNQTLLYDDSQWKFKYTFGLADYFDLDINKIQQYKITEEDRNNPEIVIKKHDPNNPGVVLPLHEYRSAIKDIYLVNENIRTKTQQLRQQFPENFNAIFIRWGDKKIEIQVSGRDIELERYVETLKKISGNCRHVFIHSDDHDAVLSVIECMKKQGLTDYNVLYITGECESGGTLACEIYRHGFPDKNKKSIEQMTPSEMFEHTEKMLYAIEIMKQADNVILDYQSNVSRFLKLYYDREYCKVHSVFDDEPDEQHMCIPPAFGFEINGYINVPPISYQNTSVNL